MVCVYILPISVCSAFKYYNFCDVSTNFVTSLQLSRRLLYSYQQGTTVSFNNQVTMCESSANRVVHYNFSDVLDNSHITILVMPQITTFSHITILVMSQITTLVMS
jgi:hypothetical protein